MRAVVRIWHGRFVTFGTVWHGLERHLAEWPQTFISRGNSILIATGIGPDYCSAIKCIIVLIKVFPVIKCHVRLLVRGTGSELPGLLHLLQHRIIKGKICRQPIK